MSASKPLDSADIEAWLRAVADGSASMSQRALARLEASPGGLAAVQAAAVAAGVHLATLTDDRGVALVVASRHPIRVLC